MQEDQRDAGRLVEKATAPRSSRCSSQLLFGTAQASHTKAEKAKNNTALCRSYLAKIAPPPPQHCKAGPQMETLSGAGWGDRGTSGCRTLGVSLTLWK